MSRIRKSLGSVFVLLIGVTLTLSACGGTEPTDEERAYENADKRENYIPKNDVEGRNYNARLRLADSPATLIWCSSYPSNPNGKAFTVPIVGKLTSGGKRPFAHDPGPDGFYGSSGEYRYGFDPSGNYHDFYNLETHCTTVPDVIQKQTTDIAISNKGNLTTLDSQAEAAMAVCQKRDTDPSKPCPEAAAILGLEVQK